MNFRFFLLTTLIIALPGCVKKNNVHIPHLRALTSYIDFQESQEDITIRVKKLSESDCKALLGDRARLLFKKRRKQQPIYPIQISISNTSEHRILLKPENIDLQLTPYQDVARRIQHSSFLHAIGGVFFALVITAGLAAGSALALTSGGILTYLFGNALAAVSAPLLITGITASIVTPFFLVVGTPIISAARGVETSKENIMMRHELAQASFKRGLLIDPGNTIDTLIFVQRPHLKHAFTITLTNKTKKLIPFHVTLHDEN